VSIFSQGKSERDMKTIKEAGDIRFEPAPAGKPEIVSTLGHGMIVTGNIVCTGTMHVFGKVTGDIHAAQLVICEGAKVEGKIIAPELVVQGEFKGTISGNNVKLQASAVVDGEIFNKSLMIEQNALFEGVARRLDKPVAAPSVAQAPVEAPSFSSPGGYQSAPELKVVS
jgi:cytoskeletal protein CcmA (bactofilin family)